MTSTKVWSGDRPRSVAGRMTSEPSAIDGRGKLNDGTSALSAVLVSPAPPVVSACAVITSTGTGESATVRLAARVPVTMISCPGSTAASAAGAAGFGATCATTGNARNEVDSASIVACEIRIEIPHNRNDE